MKFESNEYLTSKLSILIGKDALEKWKEHYLQISADAFRKDSNNNDWHKIGYYNGKADVLIDILKHFDNEELDSV